MGFRYPNFVDPKFRRFVRMKIVKRGYEADDQTIINSYGDVVTGIL